MVMCSVGQNQRMLWLVIAAARAKAREWRIGHNQRLLDSDMAPDLFPEGAAPPPLLCAISLSLSWSTGWP